MKTSDFDYYLPEELIAQTPLICRSSSRLMVLNRANETIKHDTFANILDYLGPNDVLVMNDTKVYPARLYGYKEVTNGRVEVLLLKDLGSNIWECLVKPQRRIHEETTIIFNDKLKGVCVKVLPDGICHIKMLYEGILVEILNEIGEMPLPPYIHEKLNDKDRYQTVYAKNLGSAAAPTAGLHFTDEILNKAKEKGVELLYVTLNVGLGTFRPVNVTDVSNHKMHSEAYHITKETALKLNEAIKNKKRIIAVGTTCVRTLESAYTDEGFKEESKETSIFIYPGYRFKVVDALITNFHLPKSTLIMLVSAFANKEFILKAYNEAVKEKYRFFSFGDCMLIE